MYSPQEWLSALDDNLELSRLKIPGTHNSAADGSVDRASFLGRIGGFAAKCQSLTILQQLNEGVRYIDIRIILTSGVLLTYHGPCRCGYSFSEVLSTVASFLENHPREFVMIQIHREDSGSARNSEITDEMFLNEFNRNLMPYTELVFDSEKDNPNLGELRGKVVFLVFKHLEEPQKFLPFRIFPVMKQWQSYTCQCTKKGVEEKIKAIEEGMRRSMGHDGLFANECNAVGSVKGITFLPCPKRMAEVINDEVERMIEDHPFCGVLIFDFPECTQSKGLIRKIIALNFPGVP